MHGLRFGRLTVLSEAERGPRGHRRVTCVCGCGKGRVVYLCHIKNGATSSCGCRRSEVAIERVTKHGAFARGATASASWSRMVQRCENPNNERWESYGARGITVCDRWRSNFAAFMADMGPRPGPGYSIDRIDNDGNYEPSNCRWATLTDQARNKSTNRWIVANGVKMLLVDWSRAFGVASGTISLRLKRGWSPERAVGFPALGV